MEFLRTLFALVPAMPETPAAGLPRGPWLAMAAFAAACGACVGSFLNVCIYRIPLDQSVVRPGSHCMRCGAPIRWYHNIPVFSYFALRGRCAKCGAPFSFRYAAIELFTAFLFLAVFCMWPPDGAAPPLGARLLPVAAAEAGAPPPHPPWAVFAYWTFLSGLVVGTFVDFDHFIIPDSVTVGGTVAGMVLSFLVPQLQTQVALVPGVFGGMDAVLAVPATGLGSLVRSATGACAGYVAVEAVRKGGTWWMRKRGRIGADEEAMGYGDVKLAAALGAFLGWQGALFSLVAGALSGSFAAVPLLLSGKKGLLGRMPFGPWLSLGAAAWVFWGHRLLMAYLLFLPPWKVSLFGV